jgi:xanthine dehydrogenase accessory factor
MRDVFATAAAWLEANVPFALATLVDVRNAAPAPLGATMAVTSDARIAGDIGAGCYEGEIVEACMATAGDGVRRLLELDLTSDDIVSGGSGCGGFLEVVTWRPDPAFLQTASEIAAGRRDVRFDLDYARESGERRTFAAVVPARRTLVVVGGTSLAAELAAISARLDNRTIVVDPRPAFATRERLPAADEILLQWPEEVLPGLLSERTPLVVVSHDPKIDLPALRCGLESDTPYIGLLGSRRAQAARREALRIEGFDAAALGRIRGPAGLDIGGVSMAETALSILAEIVAASRGRAGGALLGSGGTIHNDALVR